MQLAVRIHQREFSFRCPAYANRTVSAAQPFDMIAFGHCVLLIHDALSSQLHPSSSIDDSDNGDGQGFTTVKVQISSFDRGQRLLGMLRASPPSAVHTTRYANCASPGARKSGKVRTLTDLRYFSVNLLRYMGAFPLHFSSSLPRALHRPPASRRDGSSGSDHHSGNFILRRNARYRGSPCSTRKAGSDFTSVRSFACALNARSNHSNASAKLPEEPYALAMI